MKLFSKNIIHNDKRCRFVISYFFFQFFIAYREAKAMENESKTSESEQIKSLNIQTRTNLVGSLYNHHQKDMVKISTISMINQSKLHTPVQSTSKWLFLSEQLIKFSWARKFIFLGKKISSLGQGNFIASKETIHDRDKDAFGGYLY